MDGMFFLTRSSKSRSPALAVYLRGGGSCTINGVADGAYGAYWCIGRDWNTYMKGFLTTAGSWRFRTPVLFKTTSSTRYWTTWDWWGYPISNWQTSNYWTDWSFQLGNIAGTKSVKVPVRSMPSL